MKKLLLLLICSIGIHSNIVAQSITGKVIDQEGQAIAFANVILCNDADSTMLSGCTSNLEGLFTLDCPNKKDKHIQVSFVGYETKTSKVETNPMTIVLSPIIMDEVVVTGYKKLYKQENGEIVASVKGTILESFPKANDVIAQLPFVNGQNGNFTIFGKGTPLIYINNRLVQDKEELNRLMSSEIKSIKVNTMPGAKYDASVNSVIQIITEKPQGEGLSGSLYAGGKRSSVWSTEEYASLNYRNGAWDVFGSAYWIQDRQKIDMNSYQQLLVSDSPHDVTYDEIEKIMSNRLATVTGINYNPNTNHSAGVQYVYNNTNWKDEMFNNILYTTNNNTEVIEQSSYFDKPSVSHNVNAYYNGRWKNKYSLNVNADWMTGDATDRMESFFKDNYAEDINTIGAREYNLYAVKGVFSYTNNKWLSLDAGTEYSYTDVIQTYNIDISELGIDNSNDMTKQNRWAMFVSANARAGKWGFGAGIRYENINFDYYQNQVYNNEQSKSYGKFFPNIQVGYSSDNIQTVVGYERKIQYPTYSQLRSNVQYSSPFVYESGNPLLQPQIQNDFTGMFAYKELKVMLGYTIYEDYITQLMSLYDGNPIVLISTENVKDVSSSFFAVSYTPVIHFWRPNFEVGGQWQSFDLGDGQDYNKPIFKIRWNNTFSLPKEWMVNLDARWQSKGNSGIYLLDSSYRVNMGVTKQFLERKLAVSLSINDIFGSAKTKWHINNNLMKFDYDKYSDSQYVKLTVRYNFNSTRDKYRGKSSTDEMRRL